MKEKFLNNIKEDFFTYLYLSYVNIYKKYISEVSEDDIKLLFYEFIESILLYQKENLIFLFDKVIEIYNNNNDTSINEYIRILKKTNEYKNLNEHISLYKKVALNKEIGIIENINKNDKKIINEILNIENIITMIIDQCIILSNK